MYQSDKVQAMVDQLSRVNPFFGRDGLPDPPRPDEKSIPRNIPSTEQIAHMQKQLDLLTYNHLPHTFFNLEKHRSLQSILMTGKEALVEALPIRCLEATFVGMYLTQENKDVDRIPLSFRSCADGNHYQHIVLVVHTKQPTPLYGALGLSRKRTLMYKPLCYRTLYDIVMDYKREYEALGHELVDIKLGLTVTHDPYCRLTPCWRFVALKLSAFDAPHSPTNATSTPASQRARAASSPHNTKTPPPPAHHQPPPPARPPSRFSRPASRRIASPTVEGGTMEGSGRSPKTPSLPSNNASGRLNHQAAASSVNGDSSIDSRDHATSIAGVEPERIIQPTEPIHESAPVRIELDRSGRSPFVSPTQAKLLEAPAPPIRVSWPVDLLFGSPTNSTPVSTHCSTVLNLNHAEGTTVTPPPVIARPVSQYATVQTQEPLKSPSPATRATAAREDMSPLAQFLGKYSRLLPVMSEQYYKGLPVVDNSNRNAKLCFMSLEEAERDAKMENTRRIELISKLQSPLSADARKAAANRQLKSERGPKRRSHSRHGASEKGAGGTSGAGPTARGKGASATAQKTNPKSSRQRAGTGGCGRSPAKANKLEASPQRVDSSPRGALVSNVLVRAEPSNDLLVSADASFDAAKATRDHAGIASDNVARSPGNFPSLPPTPRNDFTELSPHSSLSLRSSSSSSDSSSDDDGFLMDRSRAEGGS